jgi:hypothetical protein
MAALRLAKTVRFGVQHGVQRLFHRAANHFSQVLLNLLRQVLRTASSYHFVGCSGHGCTTKHEDGGGCR